MADILQVLDGGGLLAFALVVYFQLREVKAVVAKSLEGMLEVQKESSKNIALIMERQNLIMQRQDEVRDGLLANGVGIPKLKSVDGS